MPILKIYVINLDRRLDRRARMDTIAATHGIEYQRIAAIDAKSEDFLKLAKDLQEDGPTGRTSSNTRACTLSHFKAWQEFLRDPNSGDMALILEDDVILSPAFLKALKILEANFLFGYGLIKIELGGSMAKGAFLGQKLDIGGGFGLRRSHQILTDAAAYIIHRNLAKRLVEFRQSISAPVDHFLFYPIRRRGFWGGPYGVLDPAVVVQDRSINSDIRSQPYLDTRRRRDVLRFFYEARQVPSILLKLLTRKCKLVSIKLQS